MGIIVTEVPPESLVKSRERVADHGEVFTPAWLVEDMLNLVGDESARIESRFLEPACGSGNFLVGVLRRKLATAQSQYVSSEFERRHHGLLAVMSVYGIELLADNVKECRANILELFMSFVGDQDPLWARAAEVVLSANIVQGDAMSMTSSDAAPIVFPEWGYVGRGKYQRRDFRYDNLTQRASFEGTLWDHLEEHEIFTPVRTYPPMSVKEIGG